jgi:hypothetical protein
LKRRIYRDLELAIERYLRHSSRPQKEKSD